MAAAGEGAAAAAGGSPAGRGTASGALMAQCKASLALSQLLLVKEYLKTAYSVNSERIEAFATGGWQGGQCGSLLLEGLQRG